MALRQHLDVFPWDANAAQLDNLDTNISAAVNPEASRLCGAFFEIKCTKPLIVAQLPDMQGSNAEWLALLSPAC